jgi:hypothetical protein
MSDIAIKVEGLGKLYKISAKQERYKTLLDTLANAFIAFFCCFWKLENRNLKFAIRNKYAAA